MALRDKLRERAQPFLEPGEQIHSVFLAQTGPNPWFLGGIIYMLVAKYRVVVATDRAILLLEASAMSPSKPKALLKRLPQQGLGPFAAKVYAKVMIDGERHWVHRRFKDDVDATGSAAALS
jgi:hypothetical protein